MWENIHQNLVKSMNTLPERESRRKKGEKRRIGMFPSISTFSTIRQEQANTTQQT